MSVINQMLNQLEQRGAHQVAEQDLVRAVPKQARSVRAYLLGVLLALAAGIAAWQWLPVHRQADSAPVGVVRNAPAPGNMQGDMPGVGKPAVSTPQRQNVQADAPMPGATMPASQLSFELSSVPLPATGRPEKSRAKEKAAEAAPHATAKLHKKPAGSKAAKKAGKIARTPPDKTSVAETAAPDMNGAMPIKQISPEQRSDAEFRRASALVQQGRIDDAMSGYETALQLDAGNDAARQALVALLLEKKRGKDAESLLKQGLAGKPDQTRFTMMLARLQVERGAVAEATATLEKGLPYAGSEADYQAFLAALLQRQNRNDEAVAHYQIALQAAPNNGIWLMGYGISLQALKRNGEARVAYQRALNSRTLNPDLQAYVQQRLKAL